jgi:hypothetical protein
MGGSSILAAAILCALGELLGCACGEEQLVYTVSLVEQLLTTGGGWQDQAGCLSGGFKIARSTGRLPLEVQVQKVALPQSFIRLFEQRTFLVYTGVPRLARNTLINALRAFSTAPLSDAAVSASVSASVSVSGDALLGNSGGSRSACGGVVNQLVCEAEEAVLQLLTYADADRHRHRQGSASEEREDATATAAAESALLALGVKLSRYWALKTQMAKGSEPARVAHIALNVVGALLFTWQVRTAEGRRERATGRDDRERER